MAATVQSLLVIVSNLKPFLVTFTQPYYGKYKQIRLFLYNSANYTSSHVRKKKPDKDFITREVVKQDLGQDTLVSLLLNAMVSEGSLQIKKSSYCINKGKEPNTDKQYLPEMPTVVNTEHQPWTEDYLEFKKFIHDELISLKTFMSEKPSPEENKHVNHPINYKKLTFVAWNIEFYLWRRNFNKNKK